MSGLLRLLTEGEEMVRSSWKWIVFEIFWSISIMPIALVAGFGAWEALRDLLSFWDWVGWVVLAGLFGFFWALVHRPKSASYNRQYVLTKILILPLGFFAIYWESTARITWPQFLASVLPVFLIIGVFNFVVIRPLRPFIYASIIERIPEEKKVWRTLVFALLMMLYLLLIYLTFRFALWRTYPMR